MVAEQTTRQKTQNCYTTALNSSYDSHAILKNVNDVNFIPYSKAVLQTAFISCQQNSVFSKLTTLHKWFSEEGSVKHCCQEAVTNNLAFFWRELCWLLKLLPSILLKSFFQKKLHSLQLYSKVLSVEVTELVAHRHIKIWVKRRMKAIQQS